MLNRKIMSFDNKKKITNKYFSLNNSAIKKNRVLDKYNKNKEIVYKLDFRNDGLAETDNKESLELKRLFYSQQPTEDLMNPKILQTSIEKVKSFLPNIEKLLDKANNKNIENIIFNRLKNQEYEDLLKKKIKEILFEKEILDTKMNEYIEDLHRKENDIAEAQVTINTLKEIDFNLTSNNSNYNLNKNMNWIKDIFKTNNNNNEINMMAKKLNPINIENNNKSHKVNIKSRNEDTEFMILLSKNRTNDKIRNINKEIENLKIEKNEILKKINNLEYEKDKLRNKKRSVTQELYLHYLDILKIGKDTRNEGLSWVIKEIFLLGKKVLLSYLPDFLDHLGKIFLFNQAKINLDLDELNIKIKSVKQKLIEKGFFNESNNSEIINKELLDNNNITETINSSKDFNNDKSESRNIILNNNKYLQTTPNNNSPKKVIYSYKDISINKRNFNINSLSNTNKYHNFLEKNYSSVPDINEHIHSNIKDNNYPKYIEVIHSSLNNTKYNKTLNKYIENKKEKKKEIKSTFSYDNIPNVIKLNDLKNFINQRKSESKIKLYNIGNLVDEYKKLDTQLKEMKKKHDDMKKMEMDRIFNEYLKNNYYQRYKVEKNVVLSALIGEDNINNELNKQIKKAKKYFNMVNSFKIGHQKLSKKHLKFDKTKQLKLKYLIGDTFMSGFI